VTADHVLDERLQLGELGQRVFRIGMIVGAVGVAVAIVLAIIGSDVDRFVRSWLFAFVLALSVSLGALFWVMVQHAVRAGWSVVLRRIGECVAANLQWLWILFVPVAALVVLDKTHVYHWVHPEGDALLEHKAPYLNLGFWMLRAVLFLGVWAALSRLFFRTSVAQDRSGDVNLTLRMCMLAPVGLLIYALSQSFASIDWIMSLEAHWFSTMFGVYFFAGSTCGFFAVQAIVMFLLQRSGRVQNEITAEHYQDAGKLLFAFGVVFWAYIGFSQFMLIWYANIPEETGWYMSRLMRPWQYVSVILLVGHFILPFFLLITRHTKRFPIVMAAIAAWMLLMHVIDVYWLVMPIVPADALYEAASYAALQRRIEADVSLVNFAPGLIDLACLVGIGGLMVGMTAKRMASCSLVPARDPRLNESLAFENF